jgi:hypothetical protein
MRNEPNPNQTSLFTNHQYPSYPAIRKNSEASKDAAELVADSAQVIRAKVLETLSTGDTLTAQEIADKVAQDFWNKGRRWGNDFEKHLLKLEDSVESRISELKKSEHIVAVIDMTTGKPKRRLNRAGNVRITILKLNVSGK